MAAGDLTDQESVETALVRPLTAAELNYLPGLISQASTKLRAALPSVDARIAPDNDLPNKLDPNLVKGVLAEAIKRVLTNPRGLWSSSDAAGPQSHSETYAGSRAGADVQTPGGLRITADDLAQLMPPQGPVGGTVWTRPPGRASGCRW